MARNPSGNSAHSFLSSTRARCKPGDRARIISGCNTGRVVVVVRAFVRGDDISGHSDWIAQSPAWVVTSVGQPLACWARRDGVRAFEFPPVRSMPIDDQALQPLEDDEGGVEQIKRRRVRKPKGQEA